VKALAEDSEPDHATIAEFVSSNSEAVKKLFMQIVLKCQELKLITGEMFAIDGCKLPSNAAKEWSGKLSDLKKKKIDLEKLIERIMKQHQTFDKDEEAQKVLNRYRKTLGDEGERRKRHIERLEKKLKKIDEFLETAEPKLGAAKTEIQNNITDPESAKIKGPHGYIQGYNGIAIADSKNQVIVSAEAFGITGESVCFPEMFDELETNMKLVTGKEKPLEEALFMGDTGYFSEDNLQEAEKRNVEVIIPDPQFRKRDPAFKGRKTYNEKKKYTIEDFTYNEQEDSYQCPAKKILSYRSKITLRNNKGKQYQAKQADCTKCPLREKCIIKKNSKQRTLYVVEQKYADNLSQKMREKIDNPVYRELYSRRMQIIEPVFANMTYCKGMNRFTLRTRKKVNIQWQLYAIVHNIGKCIAPLALEFGK
jgi:hypothetical protein